MVSYGVLGPFTKKRELIYSYMADSWDYRLNKVFKYYKPTVDELYAKESLHVNIIGELENTTGESTGGKYQRNKRIETYKQFLEPKLLQDEDLHDMIIDMEVPSWII